MPIAEVNGVKLVYEDSGGRSGVPLVFVHGWTANMHRWDEQVKFFSASRRVIRLNLRGHGDSEQSETGYTVKQLSEDLFALLNILDVEKAILIGHSMGGMTIQRFALDYPDKVEKLIIVNSTAKMLYSPGRKALVALSKLVPFNTFIKLNLQRAFKKGFPKDQINDCIQAAQCVPKDVVMSFYEDMCDWDISDNLTSIKAPTLVIHGSHDIQFPLSEAKKIVQSIPNSKLKVIDCGHESPMELPQEVTAAIAEFI